LPAVLGQIKSASSPSVRGRVAGLGDKREGEDTAGQIAYFNTEFLVGKEELSGAVSNLVDPAQSTGGGIRGDQNILVKGVNAAADLIGHGAELAVEWGQRSIRPIWIEDAIVDHEES